MQARARTLERQRELNFYCRVVEAGTPDHEIDDDVSSL